MVNSGASQPQAPNVPNVPTVPQPSDRIKTLAVRITTSNDFLAGISDVPVVTTTDVPELSKLPRLNETDDVYFDIGPVA